MQNRGHLFLNIRETFFTPSPFAAHVHCKGGKREKIIGWVFVCLYRIQDNTCNLSLYFCLRPNTAAAPRPTSAKSAPNAGDA